MREIDDQIESIVCRALHYAGVRDTDGDAGILRRYAVAEYLRITIEDRDINLSDIVEELTQALILRRYRDWSIDDYLKMKTPVPHTEEVDLIEASFSAHLNHNERDVIYLSFVIGMSTEQIIEKFGVGSNWVEATLAEANQIRRVDEPDDEDAGGLGDGNKGKS